jgi:hypothetical protein
MRIRSIKPEFAASESMGHVSREARLLFILLWTIADDDGRTRGNHRYLAHHLFPYDSDAERHIATWLRALESEGCIHQYHEERGDYIAITHWKNHQKIDHPRRSKLPAPAEVGQTRLELPEMPRPVNDTLN